MRDALRWLLAVAVLLSIGGSGCSPSRRSKELAVLDRAYQSGVLTKDEYEAKKAGLESQSEALEALDKALSAGVVTQADYQAIKARLIAKAVMLASLERARQAGVFSQKEYLARKAALLAADATAAPPAEADAAAAPSAPLDPAPEPADTAAPPSPKPVAAPGGLKTINPPEGGQIVYGQVEGQTTEAGAMGAVLRSLHNQLGERPQVGKLFQVRGTQSVAAFFSVSRRTQGGGQIAGLIIATKATSDRVEAALISDDAARFPKTLNPMMKTLFGVWHPLEAARSAGSESSSPAPLRQITLEDRSASVGLPDGWKIVPKMSMMGTIVATGPNDESAELGITFLASDTNNPTVQQTLQALRNGRLRNTAYATANYYPYGGDMSKAFVYFIQNVRRKAGLPQATYNFTSVTPVPGSSQERCVHMAGTVDTGDGKGPRELNAVYCTTPPTPAAGIWLSSAYATSAPVQVAARERATLAAILASFNVNMSVVNAQAAKIAAPAIEQIHAIGRAAAMQAAAAHERNDIQNSSVYQRWDNLDKRSQEFENYQLGFSVISDTEHTAHGTFWNEDADALVKQHPDRFEYVSAPNYWKGIDY
ncbi:exported hypothetical protein [Candidatus Sulfopaludibacter sp. SbA4]|nr:exported hypothetical protein [Candidatus Sulfopaludibacter sp. SbA4]